MPAQAVRCEALEGDGQGEQHAPIQRQQGHSSRWKNSEVQLRPELPRLLQALGLLASLPHLTQAKNRLLLQAVSLHSRETSFCLPVVDSATLHQLEI
mmetsp:Transcript_11744/g.25483  ORF Transcript_11744/g.25483 Transcript_11744/m.25483 type:complete len:97 (-) Transcript_11744:693-983(-)